MKNSIIKGRKYILVLVFKIYIVIYIFCFYYKYKVINLVEGKECFLFVMRLKLNKKD